LYADILLRYADQSTGVTREHLLSMSFLTPDRSAKAVMPPAELAREID
jgi:hypothetical protein